jgi:hypothetical protein
MPVRIQNASARRVSHARIAKSSATTKLNNSGTKSRAKRNSTHKGRIAAVDPARIQALKSRGLSAGAIATKLKISRSSVYRYAR